MLTHSYYPEDPRVRRAAEALTQKGYDIDLICLKRKEQLPKETINNVKITRMPLERGKRRPLRWMFEYIASLAYCTAYLTIKQPTKKYQVIHIHTLPDFLVFSAITPKILGAKIILEMHEAMPEIYATRLKKSMNSTTVKIIKIIEKASIKFADKIITVSDPIKQVFIQRGVPEDKITVVMNVPEKTSYPKTTKPNNLKNKFIIIFPGQVTPTRGVDTLIEAIQQTKIPGIYLTIYGEGEYLNTIKKIIKKKKLEKRVYLGGKIPSDQVPEKISIADIGVIPSKSTPISELGVSNKIFEYAFAEKPIIVSKRKAISQIMTDKEVYFFQPGNAKELAQQIQHIYENPKEATQKAKNVKEKSKQYAWPTMKKRLYNCYKSLQIKGE